MKKAFVIIALGVLTIVAFPLTVSSQETYRFERMWPTLKQPWYFFQLTDVAIDSRGNLYITDYYNHRVQKFSSDGSFITSWGKFGTQNGQFKYPEGIAIDTNDNIYVTDKDNRRFQKFNADGTWLATYGQAQFQWAYGIAVDATGFIYVSDTTANAVKKFTPAGVLEATWLGPENKPFYLPRDIAIGPDGFIYVADYGDNLIHRCTPDGDCVAWVGAYPSQNPAVFDKPEGISVDAAGNIYVVDWAGRRLQAFSPEGSLIPPVVTIPLSKEEWGLESVAVDGIGNIFVIDTKHVKKLSPARTLLSEWGNTGEGNGKFTDPMGIALDADGNIYVTDTFNNRIQKFNSSGMWMATWGGPNSGDFNYPYAVAVDATSNTVYVADTYNHRIKKCSAEGACTSWGSYGFGNGYLDTPEGIAVDASGFVYVSEYGNDRIQKFTPDGTWVATWGESLLRRPMGIAIDSQRNFLYVADSGHHRIQKFSLDGTFIISWGGSGSGNDKLSTPHGVTVDGAGYVYVADSNNNRIQKFTPDGLYITTLGTFGSLAGHVSYPTYLCTGSDGKIYVTDSGNSRIQVFKKFEVLTNPKAIIVAGGGPYPGNNLWDATQTTANFAYRTLIYRGFTDADIYYLSSDTDLDIDNDGTPEVDIVPTFTNLQSAITEWAVNENAESLILYLDDHGGTDTFRLSGTETLAAAQLASWLDVFEAGASGTVAVIYEACESGSFMDNLQGDDRIIITSTLPDEQAKFLSQGTLSFSSFFWTHIFNGLSIGESYCNAVDIVNFAFSNQNPQLKGDAQNIYIGGGVSDTIGEAPAISSVSEPQEISGEETSALLAAEGVTDSDGIARVWAVIWPPDYVPGSSENPLLTLPSCELLPAGGDRYEGTYSAFTTDGTYQMAIYAMDRNNNTSLPQMTTVSRNYSEERKAIIIAGGSSAGITRSSIETNTGIAYDALRSQLYSDDDIYLMSATVFREECDAGSYLSNLEDQIYLLAGDPGIEHLDLTFYLIGAGNTGTFTMNDEADPDVLSAAELYGWLDSLQAAKPGRIKVIYDGDKSGSFITPLTLPEGSERIIITSSTEYGAAYFSGAGDICFSSFFWSQVAGGATLYNAFSYARQAISYLSLKNEISFSCYPPQNPLLDADGDGKTNRTADYEIARARTIGIGLKFAADPPAIEAASVDDDGTVTITALNVTSTSPIQRVWAVIKPIAYCPGYSGEETQEFTEVDLAPAGDGTYEGTYTGPLTAFKVTVYAMDVDGNTSEPSETKLYQAGGDIYEPDDRYRQANVIVINYPSPQPHTLHYDGDEDWVKFYGKEGQEYTIEADNLNQNCPVIELYLEDDLTTPIAATYDPPVDGSVRLEFQYPQSDGDSPLPTGERDRVRGSILYARILHGNCPWVEDMSYDLKVYDNFIGLTALVAGKVRDSVSGKSIDGAVITSNGIGATISTRGDYIFSEVPGNWTITSRKESYATSRDSIRIEADEEYIRQNIGMYPINASECDSAADCDDEIFCNGEETCVDKTCQPGINPCADDGIFCNGAETCSEENDSCGHAGNPCQSNTTCDEGQDACVDCLVDADCDDGIFCNGAETCVDTICQPGTDPCPEGVTCDEEADECKLPTLEVIPKVIMQSHWMPLPVFMSIKGTNTYFGGSSSITFNPPSVMALPIMINSETIFCVGLMMPAWVTGQSDDALEVQVTTGSENATGSVDIILLPFMLGEKKQDSEDRSQ